MATLTVRLSDDKHRRLCALAESRGTTLNRLIDDMATVMLAEFDAGTRFKLHVVRGGGVPSEGWNCCARRPTRRAAEAHAHA